VKLRWVGAAFPRAGVALPSLFRLLTLHCTLSRRGSDAAGLRKIDLHGHAVSGLTVDFDTAICRPD
jgi:hypothetical protein